MTPMLEIRYFGRLREVFGRHIDSLPMPETATVAGLLDALRERGGIWAEELAEGRPFRVAVDQVVATSDEPISAASEVVVFPPVTGG
jgi:molybdopterin synthase sulfur carrier subunit